MTRANTPSEIRDFIHTVLKSDGGIPSRKAYLLVCQFKSLKEFKDANFNQYTKNGPGSKKPTLSKKDLIIIQKRIKYILPGKDLAENWVKFTAGHVTRKIISNIESLRLEDMSVNPFLIRMLHFRTPEEIVRFNTFQRIPRSVVTSMGTALEYMVADCGGRRGKKGEWYDAVKNDGDDTYWIQIKSGPNDVDKDQMEKFNDKFNDLAKKPRQHPRLGIVYGRRDQDSISIAMAKKYLDSHESRMLVGRELWDFISGEANFHRKILDWVDEAVEQDLKGQSIDSKMQDAIERITGEFKAKHGDGKEGIASYIESLI